MRAVPALVAAQPSTQLEMTVRVSQSSPKATQVAAEVAVAQVVEAVVTATCSGRATAAIFISCRAAEFIRSASPQRLQMKMRQQQPQQVEAEVAVVDVAEEMPEQLPLPQQQQARLQLRAG